MTAPRLPHTASNAGPSWPGRARLGTLVAVVWRRVLLAGSAIATLGACGGGAPPAPTAPVVEKPSLPVLTSMTLAFTEDSVPVSQSVFGSVRALDEAARPMTVGVIAWTSDDTSIATVRYDGAVLARKPGRTTIRAKVGDVEAARPLLVLPPPPGPLPIASITIGPVVGEVDKGATLLLTAVPRDFDGRPLANRDIVFSTADDSIAVVSADGTVTGLRPGTALIEAISEGQRGAATVVVKPPLDSNIVIAFSTPVENQEIGDTAKVITTVRSRVPLSDVILTVAGRPYPMHIELVQNFGEPQPTWVVNADVSTVVFGPIALVVTATDILGNRGVSVMPVIRAPKVPGGNKSPPGSK